MIDPTIYPLSVLLMMAIAGIAYMNDPWGTASGRRIAMHMVVTGVLGLVVLLPLMLQIRLGHVLGEGFVRLLQ